MYDYLLLIILHKLQFNKLISLIFINNDIVIVMYLIKKYYLLDCGRKKRAVKLSNNGFKIKLNLRYTSITDVSKFRNIHTLDLSGCNNLTNISTLDNVYNLNLENCKNLINISGFTNVHILNLSYCKNITNVSMLGNVHTLYLNDSYNITDVSTLGNVHTLDLSFCVDINDVSMLGNVHILNLKCCQALIYNSGLDKLTNVYNLNIKGLPLFDLDKLLHSHEYYDIINKLKKNVKILKL
jgi:hypothetical protein